MSHEILGIDIGGSGIKGAIVNVKNGKLLSEKLKLDTPQPATPQAVAETVKKLIEKLNYNGSLIGCGFPAIIHHGVANSAANIDKSWIKIDVEKLLSEATGKKVYVANDADVAGIAEHTFGNAEKANGSVILLTLGTGVGSALIYKNELVPNTEFGHMYMPNGMTIEDYTANSTRENESLTWETYGKRLNEALKYLEFLFSPELFILGGGISKKFDLYSKQFTFQTRIKPAEYLNEAGIIGAALYAYSHD